MKTKISSDNARCVSEEHFMLKPSEHKPPLGVNLLILTNLGKTMIGKWNDNDCVEWFPLPRRSKKHN